ncbi:molybdopterin dinucleotide binding domain-containing protein [Adlercreutzia rubneri]
MNAAKAKEKGLANGDKVRLSSLEGASVEGVLATSEGVHAECVSVIGGHWGSKSKYMPRAFNKGVPVVHLIPGQTPDRLDHICSAFDQCVRVKIEKIA